MVGEKAFKQYFLLKLMEMRVAVTYRIRSFTFGTEEGFHLPVVDAFSDPVSSGCKKWASRYRDA